MVAAGVQTVETKPIDGQKPGTSGLRKKVTVFQQQNYLENFIQSTLSALPQDELTGKTLVVSGDGRYFSKDAINIIVRICAANGVGEVWVGRDGLMSTPAVSAVVRTRKGGSAYGAFILTASHNPGGPHEDFGVKYNCANGGPAPEKLTDEIFKNTQSIKEYHITEALEFNISKVGTTSFMVQRPDTKQFGPFNVQVIDPIEDYLRVLKGIFDFGSLKALLSRADFKTTFDAMHGVAGPYARRILVEELGADPSALLNCDPKEDFGGGHPDPNLTYAKQLVAVMGLGPTPASDNVPDFGAAADGDADRNMILGRRFFVTPSDSVAIIAAYASDAIPFFRSGLKGVARSMPTSAALDRVAEAKGIPCYETPTGWKFFGNLMDAGKCSLCGEESFGTGSDHIREKDGLWAVLAWLSILAYRNSKKPSPTNLLGKIAQAAPGLHLPGGESKASGPMVTVEDVVREHWATYGRNFYTRYDFENVELAKADAVMKLLKQKQGEISQVKAFVLDKADDFSYSDPVDGSVTKGQGLRFLFTDGSRVIFRLSGTGSEGATIRVYIEKYVGPEAGAEALGKEAKEVLAPLVDVAYILSNIVKLTGRKEPTVIT